MKIGSGSRYEEGMRKEVESLQGEKNMEDRGTQELIPKLEGIITY
jgi:hypothetical protein